MKKNKVIKVMKKAFVKLARETAINDANSACGLLVYQKKEPVSIKKLRKF